MQLLSVMKEGRQQLGKILALSALLFLQLPAVNAAPAPSPTPAQTVNAEQAKELLKNFQGAQASERAALQHRHKLKRRELKTAQAAKKREWERQRRLERLEYFKKHGEGKPRREYMRQSRLKRSEFYHSLKSERDQVLKEEKARSRALREKQAAALKKFQEHLKKGQRPPEELWPGGH